MGPEEKAYIIHIKALEEKIVLMRKLNSEEGFFSHYIKNISMGMKQEEAFNATNEKYLEFYEKPRYSCFKSFKSYYYRKIKNRNKKK